MLVVPLKGDKIKLLGIDGIFIVSSYTSFKPEPAVYLTDVLPDGSRSIFFSKIIELNDIKVEYDESSRLLKALGTLKHRVHLPQEHDKVTYTLVEADFNEEKVTSKVTGLHLHSKTDKSKSLKVKVESGITLELTDIIDIQRAGGAGFKFSAAEFQHKYIDYLSVQQQVKAAGDSKNDS